MFKRTRLIQRLKKPYPNDKLLNALSFGGGLLNGGINKQAMELINDVFRFDYMGAAEFEFGAVPEAMQRLLKEEKVKTTINIKASDIRSRWVSKRDKVSYKDIEVYILCAKNELDDVEKIVRSVFNGEKDLDLKCGSDAARSVDINTEDIRKSHGWLELDNGFFFFVDKEMWNKTCALFGV